MKGWRKILLEENVERVFFFLFFLLLIPPFHL
jgi:hypothetical protein